MAKAELFGKDLPESERVFYYDSLEDDPIKTDEQEKHEEVGLPDGHKFIHKNPFYLFGAGALFRGFYFFGKWYEKHYLEAEFKGLEKIRSLKNDQRYQEAISSKNSKKSHRPQYVIYANHTNPYHDVFGPAMVAKGRIRTVISPVNLKLPGIGWTLPAIGGLPLGKTHDEKQAFNEAVDYYISKGQPLVVYPEAHVWPYYTGIRKFPAGDKSFKYAVRNKVPIFTMTTTYQKSHKNHARPRMTIYIDGPFYPDPQKSDEKNRQILADKAYKAMKRDSKHSNYEYFKYVKKPKT